LFTIVSQRLDTFILYLFYDTGETSQYYWALRIAQVCQEFFFSIFTGLFPLLTKIFSRNDNLHYRDIINSFLRIINFGSVYFFGLLIVSSEFLIKYILGYDNPIYYSIIKFAFLAYVLKAIAQILITSSLAQGKTKIISIGSIVSNSTRTIGLLFFYNYGPLVFVYILVIQQMVLSIYYVIAKKIILSFDIQLIRNLFYLSFSIIFAMLIPTGLTINQSFLNIIFYFIITIILGFFVKPINRFDVDNILNTIGLKSKSFKNIILLFSTK